MTLDVQCIWTNATSYAVEKMISENGFSDNQLKKSSFHRLLGGVCTLYSIGEWRVCSMYTQSAVFFT